MNKDAEKGPREKEEDPVECATNTQAISYNSGNENGYDPVKNGHIEYFWFS